MFYEVDRDALALLRTAKAHHRRLEPRKPLSEGSRVALGLVAEHAGLKPEALRYERTARYLVREGRWRGRNSSAVYQGSTSTGLQGGGWRCCELLSSVLARYFFLRAGGRASTHVRYASYVVISSVVTPSSRRAAKASPTASEKCTRSRYATTCRVAVEDQGVHVATEYEAVLDGLS